MMAKMASTVVLKMLPVLQFAFLLSLFCGVESGIKLKEDPPKWPPYYIVSGTLKLPYAEIKEPFYAYYDAKHGRSRIDYYGGMVKTVQIAASKNAFGKSYKVTPMTTEKVTNVQACFLQNGTKDAKIEIQGALPDLATYKLVRMEKLGGTNCKVWQNITVSYGRKSTYSLWVEVDTNRPKRFEMMGYDSLLGSHYDKYYLDYNPDYKNDTISDKVFDITEITNNLTCGGFPGPGIEDHRLLMNPMQEYINNYDEHLEPMFNHFKKHHKKSYKGNEVHARKNAFMHNLRFIHSTNRAGYGFSVAVNHMADWTDGERKAVRGRLHSKVYNGGLPFNKYKYSLRFLPDNLDWRLYGAVTQVKDQATCGSCWSFGTTGTIEGAYFLKTGKLVRLSQQELVDCSWGELNNGCDGGEDFRAYQWIKKHGLAAEDAYGDGSYLGQNSNCAAANATPVVTTIKTYYNVTSGDAQALKAALTQHGPVSIAIDASPRSFSFYSNGVYYEPTCHNGADDLDHAVLAVGYGTINGQPYWLVKNSWSTYWGNDGYILMAQKNNNCGVMTDPTFVEL